MKTPDLTLVQIVTGLVGALFTLLISFGVDITGEQIASITGFLVAAIVADAWIRGKRAENLPAIMKAKDGEPPPPSA